jgi:hypothetical protein
MLCPALAEPRFGRLLMVGLTIFAPVVALGLSGATVLRLMVRPLLMVVGIGAAVLGSTVGGLAFGALLYVAGRFSEPRRGGMPLHREQN